MELYSGMKLLGLCLLISCVEGGILFPDEFATLVSIAYANIPPTKIGTDSRVGFGFRLGPNADGQVLLELGPQRDTQALGQDASKRDTKAHRFDRKSISNTDVKENTVTSDAEKKANLEKLVGALQKWFQTVSTQQALLNKSTDVSESKTRLIKSSP